jgi:hypothetical protein
MQIMQKIILSTLLIIFSGVVFSACNKTANQAAVTQEAAPVVENQQPEDGGGFTGNIKDLMGFNKTQKCTWTAPEQGEGTVYVAGKKTRSEFKMVAMEDQSAQQMFNISDDEWAYSWNPVTKKGMKVKIEEMDEEGADLEDYKEENQDSSDAEYQELANQDYEFKCENWRADPKMFVAPTDVEFTDMNVMVEQLQQGTQNMKQVCNMLSGAGKAECLAGFEE